MRPVVHICLLTICLGLAGCSNLGKKSPSKQTSPAGSAAGAGWLPPRDGPGTVFVDHATPAGLGGILAGRVLDSYDHRPPPTFIQVVAPPGTKGAPAEVSADGQGYFTIQGLEPGKHYQLIARTRDGETKLAGTTWAIPPNPRVLIFISNDFATPNTPAAPGPPSIPGQKPAPQAAQLSPPSSAEPAGTNTIGAADANRDPTKPSSIGPFQRSVEIGAPVRIDEAVPKPATQPDTVPTQPRLESIADDPSVRPRFPKPASIPPQANGFEQPRLSPAPTASLIPSAPPAVATRVPSCVLTGRQLDNFALNDLNGQPWEYRHHTGKLVLLDFWGTWCIPCRQAIPHLNILQATYGRSGLEVVGIAYEEGPLQEQIRKVSGVRDRMGINYRLLLGSGSSCPVKTQFAINAFPTLILLDQNNRIIWRQEGLDAYKLQELDTIIRQQLSAP